MRLTYLILSLVFPVFLGITGEGLAIDWQKTAHIVQTSGAVLALLVPALLAMVARYVKQQIAADIEKREVVWKEKETNFTRNITSHFDSLTERIEDRHHELMNRIDEREKTLRKEREDRISKLEDTFVPAKVCEKLHEDLERWLESKIEPFSVRTARIEEEIRQILVWQQGRK